MKPYRRAPTFPDLTCFEQVRSVAALHGDHASAAQATIASAGRG